MIIHFVLLKPWIIPTGDEDNLKYVENLLVDKYVIIN